VVLMFPELAQLYGFNFGFADYVLVCNACMYIASILLKL